MVSDIQSRAILRKLRNIYARVLRPQTFGTSYENATVSGPAASELIRMRLLDPKPAMICRMGNVELRCVLTWHAVDRDRSRLAKAISYIRNRSESFWWEDVTIETMCHNAGFFPPDTESLARFSALMLDDMKEVDILGSWQRQERILDRHLAHAVKIPLPDLEPYYHREPWSSSLEGRAVLVVHPYAESIEAQFPKRQFLFNNGFRLPDFELKTLKTVQSIGNTPTGFKTWFDALNHMKDQISSSRFDVAIVGCGAYGFPLAAHVKRMGRKAVHLGGATQVLFGISGRRWDNHEAIGPMMNEHWVRPRASEVPGVAATVEGGAYW